MEVEYDKNVDAKYIRLKTGKVAKTERIEDWLLFDYSKSGDVLGLEVLDASKHPIGVFTIGGNLAGCYGIAFRSTGKEEGSAELEFRHEKIENSLQPVS